MKGLALAAMNQVVFLTLMTRINTDFFAIIGFFFEVTNGHAKARPYIIHATGKPIMPNF
jgi:hypothetical protein